MRVMIGQLRYLPCLQHLRRTANVDLFVILDNVQRASEEFENRNKILIDGKEHWLTIPIYGNTFQKTRESRMDVRIFKKHFKTIQQVYGKEKFFDPGFLIRYFVDYFSSMEGDILYDYLEYTYGVMFRKFQIETKFELASDVLKDWKLDGMTGVEKLKAILWCKTASEYVTSENAEKYGVTEKSIGCKILIDRNLPVIYDKVGLEHPFLAFVDCLFRNGCEHTARIIHEDLYLKKPGYYSFNFGFPL